MKLVDLVPPALWLGMVSAGAGVGSFALGAEPMQAVIITALVPTVTIGVLAGLGGIVALGIAISRRGLNAIDPGWEGKVRSVNGRLNAAVYHWQLREFGFGSKAFRVQMQPAEIGEVFGSFVTRNDSDYFEFEGSEDEFDLVWEAREEELTALVPSAEAEKRLHADLWDVLMRHLKPDLRRELLRRGELSINTTFWP